MREQRAERVESSEYIGERSKEQKGTFADCVCPECATLPGLQHSSRLIRCEIVRKGGEGLFKLGRHDFSVCARNGTYPPPPPLSLRRQIYWLLTQLSTR